MGQTAASSASAECGAIPLQLCNAPKFNSSPTAVPQQQFLPFHFQTKVQLQVAVLHNTDKVPRHSRTSLKTLTQWQPLSAQPDNCVSLLLLQEAWGELPFRGYTEKSYMGFCFFSARLMHFKDQNTHLLHSQLLPAPFHRSSKSGQDLKWNSNFISLIKHNWEFEIHDARIPFKSHKWVRFNTSQWQKKSFYSQHHVLKRSQYPHTLL